jgi:hypothetical protein
MKIEKAFKYLKRGGAITINEFVNSYIKIENNKLYFFHRITHQKLNCLSGWGEDSIQLHANQILSRRWRKWEIK